MSSEDGSSALGCSGGALPLLTPLVGGEKQLVIQKSGG